MTPLETFIIVLMAGVGICSLRRVWAVLKVHSEMHENIQKFMETQSELHRYRWHEDEHVTKLESERKD